MYDPTIGRWLSEDPIGFAGGDVNLYRYVGSSPTNFTDPDGQQKKPPTITTRLHPTKDGFFDQLLNPNHFENRSFLVSDGWLWFACEPRFQTQTSVVRKRTTATPQENSGSRSKLGIANPIGLPDDYKDQIIGEFGALKPTKIPTARPTPSAGTAGCPAGKNITVTNPPHGYLVGSQGADTCIGVMVTTPPDKSGNVYVHVFHFQGTDANPGPLFNVLGDCPKGSRVALFGGNNEPGSNSTLYKVRRYFVDPYGRYPINRLKDGSFISDGFSDTSGLWTDGHGNYYTYPGDGPSQNK